MIVVKRADTSIAATAATAGFYNIQTSGCAGDAVRYILDAIQRAKFNLHANALARLPSAHRRSGREDHAGLQPHLLHQHVLERELHGVGPRQHSNAEAHRHHADGGDRRRSRWSMASRTCNSSTASTPPASDGTPDSYVTAPSFANWSNVMAVRAYILARNIDATPGLHGREDVRARRGRTYTPSGADVHYRRHVYSEPVRLNNPSGRRE